MAKKSNEQIKLESNGLVGPLATEANSADAFFSDAAKQLLKFHGIYEQHNREASKHDKREENYTCMIRTKLPGGQLTAEQYLAHDWIASEFGNNTLRITTRQDFQFHGVVKRNLPATIRHLNEVLVTSMGACGDIVRNVMACPAPTADPQRLAVQEFAFELTRALFPRTNAYHQIWINGEAMIEEQVVEEPLYGPTYLPRKFKIAIAFPGDNCVDVFTNDVGLVAEFDNNQQLIGFHLLAGGGLGTTHNNDATYARLADNIAFVEPGQVVEAIKAIVTIHRDFGDRTDRKHARLKYIVQEWGVPRFREELQNRVEFDLQPARTLPSFDAPDHLGWNEQGDGLLYLGIPVENGRIADWDGYQLRTGLRTIVERFKPAVRLTAQQNLLLVNIQPQDREAIEALLTEYGIRRVEDISNARRYGLACPALPTCSLAITEAERFMPSVITQFESVLDELGLSQEPLVMRMTGCPNGCARPYVAEIAFVGRSLNKYTVFLGGNPIGTRLAQTFVDLVPGEELATTLKPVLTYFRDTRNAGEAFGDFCVRVGLDRLRELVQPQEPVAGD